MLRHALINAFVSPTNKNNSLQLRVTPRGLLPEQLSSSRHQHNRRIRARRARFRGFANAGSEKRFHSFKQRLWLQHHAFATSERPVIHSAMPILGEHSQVLHMDLDQAGFSSAAQNAMVQRPHKKLRENRDEIEAHLLLV